MFYLLSSTYVGPNRIENMATEITFWVQDTPERDVFGNKIIVDGELGTIGDFRLDAWGEFETLDEVIAEVKDNLTEGTRPAEREGAIIAWYDGEYIPVS